MEKQGWEGRHLQGSPRALVLTFKQQDPFINIDVYSAPRSPHSRSQGVGYEAPGTPSQARPLPACKRKPWLPT